MQPNMERGSIDNPLNADVALIHFSVIAVCLPNTYIIICLNPNVTFKMSQNCTNVLYFSAFHDIIINIDSIIMFVL